MGLKTLFIYDWDDNIMVMPSILHLEKRVGTKWVPVNVTPSTYAKIKYDPNIRDFEGSYEDFHVDELFIRHLSKAINQVTFGPSYKNFKETLINGDDFAILTARGHSPNIIKLGVSLLIFKTFSVDELLAMEKKVGDIGEYLSNQEYYTVSSPQFNEMFETDNTQRTKDKKSKALLKFINDKLEYYNDFFVDDFLVIFSDDDLDNVEAAVELFTKLKLIHSNIDFKVFDTSEKIKKKILI